MDLMNIYALAWRMNLHTPCKHDTTMTHLTNLVSFIITEAEKHFNKKQVADIILAMLTSALWHKGYYRMDRTTPYVIHPLEVIALLFTCEVHDYKLTIATILHDVVEDETDRRLRYNKRKFITLTFGGAVRDIVELVTKSRHPHKRKLFFPLLTAEKRVAVAFRGMLLKLADCAENTKTFGVFDEKKREEKIAEVKREYPPLFEKTIKRIRRLSVSKERKGLLSGVAKKLYEQIVRNISQYE